MQPSPTVSDGCYYFNKEYHILCYTQHKVVAVSLCLAPRPSRPSLVVASFEMGQIVNELFWSLSCRGFPAPGMMKIIAYGGPDVVYWSSQRRDERRYPRYGEGDFVRFPTSIFGAVRSGHRAQLGRTAFLLPPTRTQGTGCPTGCPRFPRRGGADPPRFAAAIADCHGKRQRTMPTTMPTRKRVPRRCAWQSFHIIVRARRHEGTICRARIYFVPRALLRR